MKRIPHTYVIVFAIIVICALLTWVIPGGKYIDGLYTPVQSVPQTWQVFSALFEGFVDKADIVIFILIIGGAFWIVNSTHAFDIGTLSFLKKTKQMEKNRLLKKIGVDNFIITAVMLMFSIFGAVFGMSEETIAFIVILVPMAISMGYDSITGVCMVFVAAALGFAGAILNPFTIGIAQGLSDLPLFSGIEYRMFCWVIINVFGFAWILRYAAKVKKNPQSSIVYEDDAYWRERLEESKGAEEELVTPKSAWVSYFLISIVLILFSAYYPTTTLKIGNSVYNDLYIIPLLTVLFIIGSVQPLRTSLQHYILNILFFVIFFLIVGVMGYGWYVMEISALFLGMGIATAIAAGYTPNETVKHFMDGCKDIFSAALVVGLAGGIIIILKNGMIIDTILHSMATGMEGLGKTATLGAMYLIQNVINIFIPSGSAKAALTMPIMAPFSDLIGISRQATVMAFQFGDGFTNMLTPTSGVLIAVLGMARIPYNKWVKWVWKFIVALIILGFLLLIPTAHLQLNGF